VRVAMSAGLHPLVEYLLQPTLAARGDQSGVPLHDRVLTQGIKHSARRGNIRVLRLLLGAAAGGPASEEAKAALCSLAGSSDLPGMQLLLAEGVPPDGRSSGAAASLHTLMCRSDGNELVSGLSDTCTVAGRLGGQPLACHIALWTSR
jgi:hypothetical protein